MSDAEYKVIKDAVMAAYEVKQRQLELAKGNLEQAEEKLQKSLEHRNSQADVLTATLKRVDEYAKLHQLDHDNDQKFGIKTSSSRMTCRMNEKSWKTD